MKIYEVTYKGKEAHAILQGDSIGRKQNSKTKTSPRDTDTENFTNALNDAHDIFHSVHDVSVNQFDSIESFGHKS